MPAQLSYKTLREENSAEFIINKSRFIGYGCPCETEEEALAFLARIRQKHKDATHNCYAYIIGLNSGIMRYSDDGEPGGTAGMPIIEVMKARGVVNCAVVVTRYFGGILLGAGGLVRAYAQGSKTALDAAGVVGLFHLAAAGILSPLRPGHHRTHRVRRERRLHADGPRPGRRNPAGGYHPCHRRQSRNAGRRHAVLSVAGLRGHKMSGKYLLDAPDYIVI